MWWPALGGLVVGAGAYFDPRVLGVGYDVIGEFLQGNADVTSALRLVGLMSLVWVFALASGTSGGVLAPLLIMGSGLGASVAHLLPGAASLWPLVGMAAVMGGMMRSPFTAVIFALELTHDIAALPPLLVAGIAAYACTVLIMKRSILTEKVARRGHDIFREYGVDPLERVRLKDVMSREVVSVPSRLTCGEIARDYFGRARKHRGYPLIGDNGVLIGVVTESDVLAVDPSGAAPRRTPVTALPDESCRAAAERMASHGIGRLVIVEPGAAANVIGIVTRSDLLKARLRELDEEGRRERIIGGRVRV
jgi:CBS domain-containing protein